MTTRPKVELHQRAWDLMRQMRGYLSREALIDIHEYVWLAERGYEGGPGAPGQGSPAPRRLETYDEHQARLVATQARLAACEAALKHCHELLQGAHSLVDPETHPEIDAAIGRVLRACDEANDCPAYEGKGR